MIIKAPAKINLGLHIKRKQEDGFHEIESIFYPVPLIDFVELIPDSQDSFSSYNIEIPGKAEDNLCVKALKLMRSQGYEIPTYHIHLLKNIPIGAGLGGGSSDAVAIIKGLNTLHELNLSLDKQMELAAELGSDCPFFCVDGAARVTGRGEFLDPIDFSLSGKFIHLIYPNLHISTSEAYESIDLENTTKSKIQLPQSDDDFRESFINDFEAPLAAKHPVLQRIKTDLYDSGAFYISLSGSGSTIFGLFNEKPKTLFESEGWQEWILKF